MKHDTVCDSDSGKKKKVLSLFWRRFNTI